MSGWKITPPFLTDEERAQVTQPEGLSGADDPGDNARSVLAGLQALPTIYPGTVPHEVKQSRRNKNRQARQARRVNRLRSK